MNIRSVIALSFWVSLFPLSDEAMCEVRTLQKTYELTGTVEKMTPDRMILYKGGDFFEFNRNRYNTRVFDYLGENIKVGDKITVTYSMDVRKVKIDGKDKGQAGQVPPQDILKDKNIIIDDRAFYPAKVGKKKNESDHS